MGQVTSSRAENPRCSRARGSPENTQRRLQSGALAYRHAEDGELRILLVSKRRSKQWGIPKGTIAPGLSFGAKAAKEAFEEAGVEGIMSLNSVGVFRAVKRNLRQIKWVPCSDAATELREPMLSDLCRGLAERLAIPSVCR